MARDICVIDSKSPGNVIVCFRLLFSEDEWPITRIQNVEIREKNVKILIDILKNGQ